MMSLEKSIAIDSLRKLIVSASCHVCGKFYAESRLASCGDRICASCGKNSTECPTCKDTLDPDYLQEDPLMHKLAQSVRKVLDKFQKLEDISGRISLDKSWQSGKRNSLKSVTSVKSTNVDSPVSNGNLKVVVKRMTQGDFDKIEYFEESQLISAKATEKIDNIYNGAVDQAFVQRPKRCKPIQDIHEKQVTDKVITEAIVETGNPKSIEITLNDKKSASKLSKPSNWKNVRKMNKELCKIKKRDIKKLNVSIEMCKKTQAVISKAQTSNKDDLPIVIEDTPQYETLPEVVLDGHQKEEKENTIPSEDGQKITIDSSKFQKKSESVVILSNVLLSHQNTHENELTPQEKTINSTKIGHNLSSIENINVVAKGEQLDSDKLFKIVRPHPSCERKRNLRQETEMKAKTRPMLPKKQRPREMANVKFKSKVSILNISTPGGRFIITGRNIFVQKSLAQVPQNERMCVDASTNTVVENDVIETRQSERTYVDASVNTVSENVEVAVNQINKTHDGVSTSTFSENAHIENNQNDTNNVPTEITLPKTSSKSFKPNTASQQTTSGPYKISESIDKGLVSEMEGIEDLDIFNSCSGPKTVDAAVSRDIFHTELVEASCQKSEAVKRQIEQEFEPLKKKIKKCNSNSQMSFDDLVSFPPTTADTENETNEQATPQNGSFQLSVQSRKKLMNKDRDPLTNDFDEITSAALFAQIDADLRDEESKKSPHKNQKADSISDVEDEQEVLGLKTPKSTQNVINIDSDSSFVEETPQKDNPSKMSSNLAEISSITKKGTSATKDDHIARSPATPIASTESPLTQTFHRGISDESTPLRTVPRRSLNYDQVQDGNETCSKISNNSINEVAKNTLEKEFMEEAFEKTQVTPVRRPTRLRKVSPLEAKKGKIACSVLTPYERAEVSRFAKKFRWDLVEQYTQSLTHLIVGVEEGKAQRTVKYMQAIAASKWILSFEWIKECLKTNKIVDEAPYEVIDMNGDSGPYLSRTAKHKLFEGMLFYCHPPFTVIEQAALEDILKAAGGRVARTMESVSVRHTTQIALMIAEPESTIDQDYTYLAIQKHVVPVNYEWVLNCLGSYTQQPLQLLCPAAVVLQAQLAWPRHLLDFDDDYTQ